MSKSSPELFEELFVEHGVDNRWVWHRVRGLISAGKPKDSFYEKSYITVMLLVP